MASRGEAIGDAARAGESSLDLEELSGCQADGEANDEGCGKDLQSCHKDSPGFVVGDIRFEGLLWRIGRFYFLKNHVFALLWRLLRQY